MHISDGTRLEGLSGGGGGKGKKGGGGERGGGIIMHIREISVIFFLCKFHLPRVDIRSHVISVYRFRSIL